MELKPIKQIKETQYPTIKEVPKSNFIKQMLPATIIDTPMLAVAVPSYMVAVPPYMVFIKGISIIIAILSLILLFINKIKIKRCKNEMKETLKKLKKHRKIELWILGISITIFIITSLVIYYLKY